MHVAYLSQGDRYATSISTLCDIMEWCKNLSDFSAIIQTSDLTIQLELAQFLTDWECSGLVRMTSSVPCAVILPCHTSKSFLCQGHNE